MTVRNAVEAVVNCSKFQSEALNPDFTRGTLTVSPGDFRIWLRDIGTKVTDVLYDEATNTPSAPGYTPVYYPCCHSSDLIGNSFVDLWGYGTCDFNPYLAVACPRAVRQDQRSRRQWLLTEHGSMGQILRAC